ncbi:helix-turn-helix domain-containing protein [Brevibacillus sp. NRS-1366]|uniref:helix-turn-helix domain-containing protein n=1 Tax=Brevibacillus sp. NRS-1366 TaxID=3233899 RepID=UPI003D219DF0
MKEANKTKEEKRKSIYSVQIRLDQLIQGKMSQQELSRKTGIRQPSISEMCRNESKHIPLENLALLCEELQCNISDLLILVDENGKELTISN